MTQPGDLWILGNRRLLCGDSSVRGDVDSQLEGARIHVVNTDPPYCDVIVDRWRKFTGRVAERMGADRTAVPRAEQSVNYLAFVEFSAL